MTATATILTTKPLPPTTTQPPTHKHQQEVAAICMMHPHPALFLILHLREA
jgi:hypothetical protein